MALVQRATTAACDRLCGIATHATCTAAKNQWPRHISHPKAWLRHSSASYRTKPWERGLSQNGYGAKFEECIKGI